MQCNNCPMGYKKEATSTVWCPTWINSKTGPRELCESHADNFRPEVNPNAKNGQFFFGTNAKEAYDSVELFLSENDERYENALNMAEKGTKISCIPAFAPVGDVTLYVVDGKVWLVTYKQIARLGPIDKAKKQFPKLFKGIEP